MRWTQVEHIAVDFVSQWGRRRATSGLRNNEPAKLNGVDRGQHRLDDENSTTSLHYLRMLLKTEQGKRTKTEKGDQRLGFYYQCKY